MNKIIMIAFCFFCSISSAVAQNDKMQGHCRRLPMKGGDISCSADASNRQPSNSFIVSAAQNEVYSLTRGKVAVIVHFPEKDYKAVGIAGDKGDTVIVYTMLKDVSVKQGDMVNKGDFIGKAMSGGKNGKSEAAIEIKIPKKAMKLPDPEVLAFIKKADS